MLDVMNEESLNGSFGGPTYAAPQPTVSPVPQDIRQASSSSSAPGSSSQAIMLAWAAVLILAVLAHVLTFRVQA